MAEPVSALGEDGRGVGLADVEEAEEAEESVHDERDVRSPAPAKVGVGDEAADDRASDGADEGGGGEDGDGDTSVEDPLTFATKGVLAIDRHGKTRRLIKQSKTSRDYCTWRR